MAYFKTSTGVNLFYEDMGQGSPVVFIHGWPASHDMFENQYLAMADRGFRCIGYDRRGFGKSDRPWNGYDYDTLTQDLADLLEGLDLRDVTLVGFSMGAGEVVRYISQFGSERVSKAVIVSGITPYLLKSDNNPDGVDQEVFDTMYSNFMEDRPKSLAGFYKDFFGVGLINHPVSDEAMQMNRNVSEMASGKATLDCMRAFSETDFRQDVHNVNVPTLIIHGTEDKIVPIDSSGRVLHKMMPQARYVEFDGAPHGLFIEFKDDLNREIMHFIRQGAGVVHEPADML